MASFFSRAHRDSEPELSGEEHGDDFIIVGEVSMLEHVRDSDIFSREQFQSTTMDGILNVTSVTFALCQQNPL